jgi:hypothetical protein
MKIKFKSFTLGDSELRSESLKEKDTRRTSEKIRF